MKIQIKCKGAATIDFEKIVDFQAGLKEMEPQDFDRLRNEITTRGFNSPIHVWKKGTKLYNLDGHQRVFVLKKLKDEGWQIPLVPVDYIFAKDWAEAKRILLSRISQYGKVKPEGFQSYIENASINLDEVKQHFSIPEFDIAKFEHDFYLRKSTTEDDAKEDEVPEPPPKPISKLGDLWMLGEHRVLCGDCTDKKNINRLMQGEKADMVFTDPPYNIASDSTLYAKALYRKSYGQLEKSEWDKHFEPEKALAIILYLKPKSIYICCSDHLFGYWFLGIKAEMDHASYCVWSKINPMPSLTKSHWASAAELIVRGANKGHVFNYPETGHAKNVWEFTKTPKADLHPTMKPVHIPEHAILHESNESMIIWDGFLGSGSTLIACEKTGRKCFGCEIDPQYVDVIVKRWTEYTGKKAKRSTT